MLLKIDALGLPASSSREVAHVIFVDCAAAAPEMSLSAESQKEDTRLETCFCALAP